MYKLRYSAGDPYGGLATRGCPRNCMGSWSMLASPSRERLAILLSVRARRTGDPSRILVAVPKAPPSCEVRAAAAAAACCEGI